LTGFAAFTEVGRVISGSAINRGHQNTVGLFGHAIQFIIKNIGLEKIAITGVQWEGVL